MVTTRSQAPLASPSASTFQTPPQAPQPQAPPTQDPYNLPGRQQEHITADVYNSFFVFEDFATLYRIPVSSPHGTTFSNLIDGLEKIQFLKEHGEKVDKPVKVDKTQMVGAPRVMIPHKGSWIHWNEGQIEYMVPCEDARGEDSELAREYEGLKDEGMSLYERREWTVRHAVRIREWPDFVKRVDSLVSGRDFEPRPRE